MTAVQVTSVSKSFRGGRRALDRVSLSIAQGEMVALIGASGSGKSTLLRHIAGLVGADRGEEPGRIEVFGAEIQSGGRISGHCRRLRADVGFVFQQFNLVGRLSVMTNVLLGSLGRIPAWRGTLGLFQNAEKHHAMEALHRVGIADFALQKASTLSGGQQQRAAIARTLVQKARLVLADEPIASLDPASATKVMETLATVNREDGITVVVSLHQVDYALRYCPRAIAMQAGRIVYDGPSTGLTPAFLADLYGSERPGSAPAADPGHPPLGPVGSAALAYLS
ncbi:MAG: phosphonate ABC transporter ATP-binding protein [Telmatospirillum sp.]|nr:phosphonate ABC transporter ATP-binding protein [Telmatospirillum sp.]